jgi:triacylglycerol esterase/lipase EstA (alpha/beta hydrolase family)
VVFVHGTASSPARWSEMINTLQADPVLRERLQFWYFIYNTGNPTPYSASLLRESLRKIVHEVDPQGKDDAMQRMVVIGHSQGGLLTKLTAVDSGDKFWRLGHTESIEEARLTDEQRDMLRTMLFYEPLPSVRRVVFLATPHHGVFLIKSFVQNLAGRLIKMPSNLLKLGKDVLKGDPALYPPELKHRYPTSIDTMSPRNPFLRTLANIPVAPGVKSHSIIAVRQNGDPKRGNDGVVKYTSAHIEPVDSELVVRDSHSCQDNPKVIEEVRGIMIEHLDWVAKGCPGR